MIYKVLYTLKEDLNDYLKGRFRLKQDIVFLSAIKADTKSLASNRVHLSLMGIERETAGGIRFANTALSADHRMKHVPSWMINLQLLIAVIFQDKQYEESLHIFSAILSFFQKTNNLTVPESGQSFGMEPINLSLHELSNVWSAAGTSYHPSLLCQLRGVLVDEEEIIDLSVAVSEQRVNTKAN